MSVLRRVRVEIVWRVEQGGGKDRPHSLPYRYIAPVKYRMSPQDLSTQEISLAPTKALTPKYDDCVIEMRYSCITYKAPLTRGRQELVYD